MTDLIKPGKLGGIVDYDATGPQKRKITGLSMGLGIKDPIEERQMTFGEAGRLIRRLGAQMRARRRKLKGR